ncbi:MAG: hypothetical protein MMC33_006612 [Icmadophila ericetorum]|nr:hypothetical protein [Icmadophila ericetorum]
MVDLASSKEALLTEHFRYTPLVITLNRAPTAPQTTSVALIDDIINTVNSIIYQAIPVLERGLLSQPPQALGFSTSHTSGNVLALTDTDGDGNVEYPEEARIEIENGMHQLETLLEATVDKNFDKLEIYYLRNLFSVPEEVLGWVRLRHYENLPLPIPATAPTPTFIFTLRDSLRSTRKLTLALEAERAKNAATLVQLRSILGTQSPSSINTTKLEDRSSSVSTIMPEEAPLSFLTSPKTSMKTLAPTAKFTASHIPTILSLLQELRPKLATLPAQLAKGMDRDGTRDARREYINRVVQRVVVKSGVGEEGAGAAVTAGRRVGAEEVAVLEGWVAEQGGQEVEGQGKRDWEGDVGMGGD